MGKWATVSTCYVGPSHTWRNTIAKLPVIKRLQREDFPEAESWIEKLIYPLNQFMEGAYAAMNRSLTFGDNMAGEVKEFTFTTTSGYNGTAANWTALEWQRTLKNRPQGCLILQITQLTATGTTTPLGVYAPIEGDVCLDWNETNGTVTIGLVRGLAASTKYKLRVLLI